MNFKKMLLTVITIIMLVAILSLQSTTYAFTQLENGKEQWMGIVDLIEGDNKHNWAYAINGGIGGEGQAIMYKILQYDSETSPTYKQENIGDIYCLKSGVGFTNGGNGNRSPYNRYYNMKTERSVIREQNQPLLNSLVDATITATINGEEVTFKRYNAILAVLDMIHLQQGEESEKEREEIDKLIMKLARTHEDYIDMGYDTDAILPRAQLTNDDITAVQQAVLWYFTNYYKINLNNGFQETSEPDPLYNKLGQEGWLHYKTGKNEAWNNLINYTPNNLRPGHDDGAARSNKADILYDYMIKQAIEKADQYENVSEVKGSPIKVVTTELKRAETREDKCIIGPIRMEQINATPYTIDLKVENNGTEITDYQLLNDQKQQVTEPVESLVGKDFYLAVPKSQTDKLTIDITTNYKETTMKLWTNTNNAEEQPLVEITKEPKNELVTLKLEPLPEKFDLKLIKRITAVNDKPVADRIKSVDVSKLNREVDANGNLTETTAKYKMTKDPVSVVKGDIVTYTFRVYNEGTIDGYASEITEDIPKGLQFLGAEVGEDLQEITDPDERAVVDFNTENGWTLKSDMTQITTTNLARDPSDPEKNLIKAFGYNFDGSKTAEEHLKYKEISVKFKVTSDLVGEAIRNEAAITDDTDKDGNPIDDRDSTPKEWKKENDDEFYDDDKKWPIYKEDDEDYDNIILPSFDLALRKFIVAVSKNETIEENEYLKNANGSYKREPVVDTSKLNTVGADGKLITTADYNHTKEPVIVQANDIVVYMLRVYNEGEVDGYAAEIKDHLPPYLEYVESDFNKQYGWKVAEDGRTVTTDYLSADEFLIKKAEANESGKIELSYKEVPIMCRVKETAPTSQNITNIADITKYLDASKNPVTDRDSQENNVNLPADKDLPGYKGNETGSYIPGQQDDDDFEKVVIKIFDLALRKWVTEAIVIENGGQTVTQTGHDPWDDPEDVVKVELHRKKLDQVVVKFRYSIRIYNQGEVEGYAKEITDYVPQGLKFVAEDNPGWVDEGNNVISTKLLENTLLQPGESADVEVLLTWINNEDNMGVMTNTAEISIDDNPYDLPDIDSTPDNQKPGEDDIDDAPVMLSISTGQARIYFTLGFFVLITVAGGVVLIKRYVL